jgi:ferritin-like metal-binding protein YciE
MAAKSLQELFVEELRDAYDGEARLTKALPKMARAAEQQQMTRLEQVYRTVGEKPRGKKCDGIIGIVEEGNTAMEELDGPVLDAALIAGAQRVEHYEIAEEEKAADRKLNDIAKSRVNRDALIAAGMDDREEDQKMSMIGQRATADSRVSRKTSGGSRSSANGRSRGGSRGRSRTTSRRRSR